MSVIIQQTTVMILNFVATTREALLVNAVHLVLNLVRITLVLIQMSVPMVKQVVDQKEHVLISKVVIPVIATRGPS